MDSVKETEENSPKRTQFGNRFLTETDDVFKHNAWDNVEWDEEQEKLANETVLKNSNIKLTDDLKEKYLNEADQYWDKFYSIHQDKFFKDRHWLFTEFPELAPDVNAPEKYNNNPDKNKTENELANNLNKKLNISTNTINNKRCIFEIGCGVGNSINTILKYSEDKNLKIFGADFSPKAINILKEHTDFDKNRCEVFVMDATEQNWKLPFEENSIDIILMVFVLSAIKPDYFAGIIANCLKYLKKGGKILFRDYGRYDLAQLRFKNGKCIDDNFYVRGDGTMVYFFTQDEIRKLFLDAGFVEEQNIIDRRLQVNRGKMLKMYRVWIQAKYVKP